MRKQTSAPYEMIHAVKPDRSFVKELERKTYNHWPEQEQTGKLEDHTKVEILTGFYRGDAFRILPLFDVSIVETKDIWTIQEVEQPLETTESKFL